jgi:hypothetical protein
MFGSSMVDLIVGGGLAGSSGRGTFHYREEVADWKVGEYD